MYAQLFILLMANLVHSIHGAAVPLAFEPEYDVKKFLDARIVGGVEAPPGYGKHMAALVIRGVTTILMCGGSVITNQHILTAAHCIDPLVIWGQLISTFGAVTGTNEWMSIENKINFTGYAIHPKYDSTTYKNDIGVLFLAQEIVLGENVAIIPLKSGWVDEGTESFVTGWGRVGTYRPIPEKLQLLYVRTIPTQQCFDGIREAFHDWQRAPTHDPELEICTFHSLGHGMCNGDSGSALVDEKTLEQIGIVSWGFPCAAGAPDVFVRVSSYIPWLQNVTQTEI